MASEKQDNHSNIKLFFYDAPVYSNYEICGGCNQSCCFCYNSKNLKSTPIPSLRFVKSVFDELRKHDIFQVNILGGEPTILPYFKEILSYASDLGLFLGFATNGSNLDEELCNVLKKHEISMGISIHGDTASLHNDLVGSSTAFLKVQKSLDLLERFEIPHSVNYVLTKKNLVNFKELYLKLINTYKTIKVFYLNRFIPAGSSNSRYDLEISAADLNLVAEIMHSLVSKYDVEIYFGDIVPLCVLKKEYQKFSKPCSVGSDFIVIDSLGNVKLCVSTEQNLGNIFVQDLLDIWHGKELERYRSLDWIPLECKKCNLLKDCICGCHYSNPEKNQKMYDADYLLRER